MLKGWSIPEKRVAVEFLPAASSHLQAELSAAGATLQEGLLLGRIGQGSTNHITVEEIQQIQFAADAGESGEAEVLEKFRDRFSPESVAGYYAIVDRHRAGLTPDQALFLSEFLTSPTSIAAVFCLENAQPKVQVFVRTGGNAFAPTADLEILQPFAHEPTLQQKPGPVARSSSLRVWIASAAALSLLGAVIGFWLWRAHALREPAPSSANPSSAAQSNRAYSNEIKLRVERHGTALKIMWDPNSPQVKNSKRGMLQIADGLFGGDIQLSQAEAMQGVFAYEPRTADVDVRLEFESPSGEKSTASVKAPNTPEPATPIASPGFLLPVRPPSQIPAPPSVATWYGQAGGASAKDASSKPSRGGRLTSVISPKSTRN